MPVYRGASLGLDFRYGNDPVFQLRLGEALAWSAPLAAVVSGDSTVAEYPVGEVDSIASLVDGLAATDISVPGHTIDSQKAAWIALGSYGAFRAVIVQVGLNDITGSGTAAAAIGRLQAFINQIKADAPTAKVIVSQMVPAAKRWYDLYGLSGGAIAQQQWSDLNTAIAGGGLTPITGVDGRVTAHVPLLAETRDLTVGGSTFSQANCLNLIFESSYNDGIHENDAARVIIAAAWRDVLVELGLMA